LCVKIQFRVTVRRSRESAQPASKISERREEHVCTALSWQLAWLVVHSKPRRLKKKLGKSGTTPLQMTHRQSSGPNNLLYRASVEHMMEQAAAASGVHLITPGHCVPAIQVQRIALTLHYCESCTSMHVRVYIPVEESRQQRREWASAVQGGGVEEEQ
jgi:ribosomal protein S26